MDVPHSGAEGVLVTCGGRFGGYALLVQDGRLTYIHNYVGDKRTTIVANRPLPQGHVKLTFSFVSTTPGQGTGSLFINDQPVGEGHIDGVVPLMYSSNETFDVGLDTGTPVAESYRVPFKFTGKLTSVTIDLVGSAGENPALGFAPPD